MERLGYMINDLLDVSKMEAEKMVLRKEFFDMKELAKEAVLSFESQAQGKGLEIKTRFPEERVEVAADRDKIAQVWSNLLTNALKFTEKGEITVSVTENEKMVECRVADTGCGISQEDLPKVFNRFEQFSLSHHRSGPKGTGLGLSICKGLVELHHGAIQVQSVLGEGTTLTFTLPKPTPKEALKDETHEAEA